MSDTIHTYLEGFADAHRTAEVIRRKFPGHRELSIRWQTRLLRQIWANPNTPRHTDILDRAAINDWDRGFADGWLVALGLL